METAKQITIDRVLGQIARCLSDHASAKYPDAENFSYEIAGASYRYLRRGQTFSCDCGNDEEQEYEALQSGIFTKLTVHSFPAKQTEERWVYLMSSDSIKAYFTPILQALENHLLEDLSISLCFRHAMLQEAQINRAKRLGLYPAQQNAAV